jgi:hypothetical protein
MKILKTIWTERKRISEERMKICSTCEEENDGMCEKCGCVLSIKTKLPFTDCPLGKWKNIRKSV